MKAPPLLLVISLLANFALAAAFFFRGSAPDPLKSPSTKTATTPKPAMNSDANAVALEAALASGDAAALEAAGISPQTARDLLLGRSIRRAVEHGMAVHQKNVAAADGRWWRANFASGFREESTKARRELSDALASVFGFDPLFTPHNPGLDFLPEQKRNALRQITQDYDEMMAKFSATGIQLASDREKLRLLRAERERDIAALLTPQELADYELRTSPSAASVRARFGEGIETEEDFRTLFALQKAFDEKYPRDGLSGRGSPETMQARAQAERQLQAEMRAALGEEKYATLRRASDPDLRMLDSLATRLSLPATTTSQIATARDSYAAESQRINSDPALTPQDRRAQLQALAQRAKAEIAQTLGSEAADAYAQRSPWLNFLQNGLAYSTSPENSPGGMMPLGGQSVYPVPPAGGPGGTRQVINFTAASGGPGSATAIYAAPMSGPANMDNIHVTSVTLADPTSNSTVPANAGTIMVMPSAPPVTAAPAPRAESQPKQ